MGGAIGATAELKGPAFEIEIEEGEDLVSFEEGAVGHGVTDDVHQLLFILTWGKIDRTKQ